MNPEFSGMIIAYTGDPTEDEIKEMFKKQKELRIKRRKIEEEHRKGYEIFPYSLRLCILDYIPIQIGFLFNSDKTLDEYIRVMKVIDDGDRTEERWEECEYYNKILFGYFKSDKYRKVYLIWTAFVIDEFSNHFNLIDIVEYYPRKIRKLVIVSGVTIDESITRFLNLNELFLEGLDEIRLEKSLTLDFGCSKLWIRDSTVNFPTSRLMDSVNDLTIIDCRFLETSLKNLLKHKFENLAFIRCGLIVDKKTFYELGRFDFNVTYDYFLRSIFQNHLTTYLLNNNKLKKLAALNVLDENVFFESVLKNETLDMLMISRCSNPTKFDICRFAFQILTSNLGYVDLVDFINVRKDVSHLIEKLKNQLIEEYKRNVRSKYKRLKVRFDKKCYIDFYNDEICEVNKNRRCVFY